MNIASAKIFAECRDLTAAIRHARGTLVGIGCKQGKFAVTETRKVGRKWVTETLTELQSYGECVAHLRNLAANG